MVHITEGDLTRMPLIEGIKDRLFTEKVLAENINLKNSVRLMIQRETSKANIHARNGGQGKKQSKEITRRKQIQATRRQRQ